MVWGVCRRILGNHHDAEDAFQATFLVLVRKAGTVRKRDAVGNWLYGVANLTSRKAQAMLAKRRKTEVSVAGLPEPAVPDRPAPDDLHAVLDHELSRLPDRYREAIVLCDLQGKSYKQAASELRCPPGTLAARIARGRAMLAKRLARRGLAVTGGTLAVVLSTAAASASVPNSAVSSTINAAFAFAAGHAPPAGAISAQAVALTEGVLKTMLLKKLQTATVLLLALIAGLAVCGFFCQTHAAPPAAKSDPSPAQHEVNKSPSARPDEAQKEPPTKTGREIITAFEQNKARVDEEYLGKTMRVTGKMYRVDRVGTFMKETDDQHYFLTLAVEPKEDKKPEGPGAEKKSGLDLIMSSETHIAFIFPASARKELSALDRGQEVVIEGVCEGKKGKLGTYVESYVQFSSCKLVKSK
jgi:RNA polymerase sigma factor (sigma-70 family)